MARIQLRLRVRVDRRSRDASRGAWGDQLRRLYLFVYAGARAYYFEKYLPHVEKMIESIAAIG